MMTDHEAADQTAARLRGLRARAGRARRLERPHAEPDERGVGPHHRRELRLGRRRAGHEGEPRAAGLGRALRAARPARPRAPAGRPSIGRVSTRRSRRPPPTSPSRANPRSIDAIRRGRDEYYRLFDEFLARIGRSHGRLLRRPRAALQRGPRRLRSAPAPQPGGDAAQGRPRVRHRAPLVLHHAGPGARRSWSSAWRSSSASRTPSSVRSAS